VLMGAPSLEGGATFGSYPAVLETGRHLLAAELSQRLGSRGATVEVVPRDTSPGTFQWGLWYTAAAIAARQQHGATSAVGWVGAGALALLGDGALDTLVAPGPREVTTNNRYSSDAFVVAGDLDVAMTALAGLGADNGAPRALEAAGFSIRDVSGAPWSRFDVDTPADLALLRLARQLPGVRALDPAVAAFLEGVQLPGGRPLAIPRLDEVLAVLGRRDAELVVAGRVPSSAFAYLEETAACRVRLYVEERGMRAAPGNDPRSLLADWVTANGATSLVERLAHLGDAVILDTRVIMAALAGTADPVAWPPHDERYASDFGDASTIGTAWLREFTAAAAASSVPFILGGHTLASDGLRILADTAALDR